MAGRHACCGMRPWLAGARPGKKTKSDGCAGNTNTAKLSKMEGPADQEEPNPALGDHPGIGWIVGSFLAPFDEDPPDDEVPPQAAGGGGWGGIGGHA